MLLQFIHVLRPPADLVRQRNNDGREHVNPGRGRVRHGKSDGSGVANCRGVSVQLCCGSGMEGPVGDAGRANDENHLAQKDYQRKEDEPEHRLTENTRVRCLQFAQAGPCFVRVTNVRVRNERSSVPPLHPIPRLDEPNEPKGEKTAENQKLQHGKQDHVFGFVETYQNENFPLPILKRRFV